MAAWANKDEFDDDEDDVPASFPREEDLHMGSGNPSGLILERHLPLRQVLLNVLSCTEVNSGASTSQVKLEVAYRLNIRRP